jgi:hypothetical protein
MPTFLVPLKVVLVVGVVLPPQARAKMAPKATTATNRENRVTSTPPQVDRYPRSFWLGILP